jgi:hypothetical protein
VEGEGISPVMRAIIAADFCNGTSASSISTKGLSSTRI